MSRSPSCAYLVSARAWLGATQEVLRPIPSEDELSSEMCTLVHSFGMDCSRRNNLYYVGPGILLFGVGNVVQLLDLETMQQSYLPGLDGGGVGAVTVHPSRRYFVVGEKGKNPNVYVYEYPSLNLYKILRNGTEQGYSALRFNKKGTKLATVRAPPFPPTPPPAQHLRLRIVTGLVNRVHLPASRLAGDRSNRNQKEVGMPTHTLSSHDHTRSPYHSPFSTI